METQNKVLMMALVVQLGSFMLSPEVYGQEKKAEPTVSASTEAMNKVEIKKEELPEATKKVLAGNEFKDWMVTKAYKVKTKAKDASGKEIDEYEVQVKKNDVVQVLMFDKDGNLKTKEGS